MHLRRFFQVSCVCGGVFLAACGSDSPGGVGGESHFFPIDASAEAGTRPDTGPVSSLPEQDSAVEGPIADAHIPLEAGEPPVPDAAVSSYLEASVPDVGIPDVGIPEDAAATPEDAAQADASPTVPDASEIIDAALDADTVEPPDASPVVTLDAGECSFTLDAELSPRIATVGIVTWSSSLPNIESAQIEFRQPGSSRSQVAPVNVEQAVDGQHRTLLLGMKANRDYEYTIQVSAAETTCVSPKRVLHTGLVPTIGLPILTRTGGNAAASRGFIIGSAGMSPHVSQMYIFDTDGDIVWWAPAPPSASRARMDWDGNFMWAMALNVGGKTGRMDRISMDGLTVEQDIPELELGHHDFTPTPDGKIAALIHNDPMHPEACSALIEYDPLTHYVTPVVESMEELYVPGNGPNGTPECHPNSVLYHAADDSYTISDRNPNLYVKVTRDGELLWQFGGQNPLDPFKMFSGDDLTWNINHGHHMLADGRLIFFNNEGVSASHVRTYLLDEGALTATLLRDLTDGQTASQVLGDVQVLPSGSALVTYSVPGIMREIDSSGQVLQQFKTGQEGFGYAEFRESLYGHPLR